MPAKAVRKVLSINVDTSKIRERPNHTMKGLCRLKGYDSVIRFRLWQNGCIDPKEIGLINTKSETKVEVKHFRYFAI